MSFFFPNKKLVQCVSEGPNNATGTQTRPRSPAAISVGAHSYHPMIKGQSQNGLKYLRSTGKLEDEEESND